MMKVLFVGGPSKSNPRLSGILNNVDLNKLFETDNEIRVQKANLATKNDTGVSMIHELPLPYEPITAIDKAQFKNDFGGEFYRASSSSRYCELIITEGESAVQHVGECLKKRIIYKNNRIYRNTVLKTRKNSLNYRKNKKRRRVQKLIKKGW